MLFVMLTKKEQPYRDFKEKHLTKFNTLHNNNSQ